MLVETRVKASHVLALGSPLLSYCSTKSLRTLGTGRLEESSRGFGLSLVDLDTVLALYFSAVPVAF